MARLIPHSLWTKVSGTGHSVYFEKPDEFNRIVLEFLQRWVLYRPAYVASKPGGVGLTKPAALEYAKAGVRVNAVCSGTIDTPMVRKVTDRRRRSRRPYCLRHADQEHPPHPFWRRSSNG